MMQPIEGIVPRHRQGCSAKGWERCRCGPAFRASAWDNDRQRRIYKTFPTLAAAKSWRQATIVKLRSGEVAALAPTTLEAAIEAWLERAESGVVRNKSGLEYKPSVLRNYEASLRNYVIKELGSRRMADVRVATIQEFVDKLQKRGLKPSSIRNIVAPLRVVFNDAMRRELALSNPVIGVALPGIELTRDRIATPSEAHRLLGFLTDDVELWATAFYTGLRRGELQALDWASVDLVGRTIRVERSYDTRAREFVRTKTKLSVREVPFPKALVPYLAMLNRTEGLVFGPDGRTPFGPTGVRLRANDAWAAAETKRAKERPDEDPVQRITLHECRHTYASLMLTAGVDIWKVSKYMGHSSIQITVDRYGHLVKGSAADDMARFDGYLMAAL